MGGDEAAGTILTISDEHIGKLARLSDDPALLEALSFPFAQRLHDDASSMNNISSMLDIITDCLPSSRRGKNAIISASVLTILGHLLPYAEKMRANARAHGRQYELYARFRALLGEHYRQQLPMEDYASMLAVTDRTLQRACAIVAGESPLKIARRLTTLEAQRMLQYSSLTVSEIGYYLGFKDPSNFSRFFAENVGESPLSFRRARLGIM